MKKVINEAAQTVTFAFDGLDAVTFRASEASEANRDYAELHGWAARLGDNAAIQKSADNGYKVTEAMRREAVLEMVTHYASGTGDWNLKTSVRKPAQNPVIMQIAERLGITYEAAQAKVAEQFLADMG